MGKLPAPGNFKKPGAIINHQNGSIKGIRISFSDHQLCFFFVKNDRGNILIKIHFLYGINPDLAQPTVYIGQGASNITGKGCDGEIKFAATSVSNFIACQAHRGGGSFYPVVGYFPGGN